MSEKTSEVKKNITPGRLTALWKLITVSKTHNDINVGDALDICKASAMRGGILPYQDALILGVEYGFLEINSSKLTITVFTQNYIINKCKQDEPNLDILRCFLSIIIIKIRPRWLAFFHTNPDIFRSAIPLKWIEVLDNADLFNFYDKEVFNWWKDIYIKHKEESDTKKKQIGDLGEEFTCYFEKERLHIDGIKDHDTYVRIVSRISDELGFDVISIRGRFFKRVNKILENIRIDAKSSSTSNEKFFVFYLTRNEWSKAEEDINSYFFYCWVDVNFNNKSGKGPYILKAESIKNLIPTDNSEMCQWNKCKFIIDLNKHSIIDHVNQRTNSA